VAAPGRSHALSLFSFRKKKTGGSIFLFDRRAARGFRRDGHAWRTKADGRTVRETHERLRPPAGSGGGLNVYYAHAADASSPPSPSTSGASGGGGAPATTTQLQRRCYWLLEGDAGLALVQYLEVAPSATRAARAAREAAAGLGRGGLLPPGTPAGSDPASPAGSGGGGRPARPALARAASAPGGSASAAAAAAAARAAPVGSTWARRDGALVTTGVFDGGPDPLAARGEVVAVTAGDDDGPGLPASAFGGGGHEDDAFAPPPPPRFQAPAPPPAPALSRAATLPASLPGSSPFQPLIGVLHAAPSCDGNGTVQTGETLDGAAEAALAAVFGGSGGCGGDARPGPPHPHPHPAAPGLVLTLSRASSAALGEKTNLDPLPPSPPLPRH